MRVAFVHDWLVTYRGGEKVLAALAELYPEAPIYTLFYAAEAMPEEIRRRRIIYPRLLNKFKPMRKALLPFLPAFIEAFELFDYEVIISTSSCVAKGIIPGPNARHISYIHSPMRYIWDQRSEYTKQLPKIPGLQGLIAHLSKNLRLWDVVSTGRCDQLVVNSSFVAQRVKKYYGRTSTVVHPAIATDFFLPPREAKKRTTTYWLAAGALVSYKRFDLAIAACEQLGQPLIIAGSGPEESRLRKLAGRCTKFQIGPSHFEMRELLQQAEGLLFPGVEDFGMIAIEAMACGTPVLAVRGGGALDYVKPGVTGEFFAKPEVSSLVQAMERFRKERFQTSELVSYAQQFSKKSFQTRMQAVIAELLGSGEQ